MTDICGKSETASQSLDNNKLQDDIETDCPPVLVKVETGEIEEEEIEEPAPESDEAPLSQIKVNSDKPKRGRKRKSDSNEESVATKMKRTPVILGPRKGRMPLPQVVKDLTSPDAHYPNGVTPKQLADYIDNMVPEKRPAKSKNSMQVALCRETNRGRLIRLETGLYTVPELVSGIVSHADIGTNRESSSPSSKDTTIDDKKSEDRPSPPSSSDTNVAPIDLVNNQTITQKPAKRKYVRKCSGKSLSPGGVNSGTVFSCSLCLSHINRMGNDEPLLTCSLCQFKGHGSCLNYKAELSEKCLEKPWQCSECKSCVVCRNKSKPAQPIPNPDDMLDNMLFCDKCDDAYHFTCLTSTERPLDLKALWYCPKCCPVPKNRKVKCQTNDTLAHCQCKVIKALPDLTEDETVRLASYDVTGWTPLQTTQFMQEQAIPQAAPAIINQELDGQSVLLLSREDVLERLGLRLGPALKMYRRILALQTLCAQRIEANL